MYVVRMYYNTLAELLQACHRICQAPLRPFPVFDILNYTDQIDQIICTSQTNMNSRNQRIYSDRLGQDMENIDYINQNLSLFSSFGGSRGPGDSLTLAMWQKMSTDICSPNKSYIRCDSSYPGWERIVDSLQFIHHPCHIPNCLLPCRMCTLVDL
jgi:hypothetical protein